MKTTNLKDYDFKRSLLLCWPTWVGKTYEATKLLEKFKLDQDWKDNPLITYSISDGKFKQMVKSNMLHLRTPKERQTSYKFFPLEILLRTKLLLYDDLWVSDVTDAYLRDLTYILDERIKKWLPTIYTSNLNKEELSQKLNERIVSRVLWNTDVIVFNGEDKRLQTTNYYTFG